MLCITLSEKLGVTTFAAPTMAIVILVLAFGFGILYLPGLPIPCVPAASGSSPRKVMPS